METKLTFDDVGLKPVHNNVSSRMQPKLDAWLTENIKMKIPILAANMDTIIGDDLAKVLLKNGSIPIFHRFTDFETKAAWIEKFPDCFVSCGLSEKDYDELHSLAASGLRGVCFDVAQGHDVRLYRRIEQARALDLEVIAGNVCTRGGYIDLVNAGANAVKVGIGPGAACTTRLVTGFGVPQMSALLDIREESLKYKVPYIADGGIKYPGDAVKAIAAGASSVMIGKEFARTIEAAGTLRERPMKDGSASHQRNFRGQASKAFQEQFFGQSKHAPEGVDMWIDVTESASNLIHYFCNGIRSGLTYGGSISIKEFQKKVLIYDLIFRITYSGKIESSPRLD